MTCRAKASVRSGLFTSSTDLAPASNHMNPKCLTIPLIPGRRHKDLRVPQVCRDVVAWRQQSEEVEGGSPATKQQLSE